MRSELHVPEDVTSLQRALELVVAGGVVVVESGVWEPSPAHAPLMITKPCTLQAKPAALAARATASTGTPPRPRPTSSLPLNSAATVTIDGAATNCLARRVNQPTICIRSVRAGQSRIL